MEIGRILTDLRAERERIDQAINAVEALNGKTVRNKATLQRASTREDKESLSSQAGKNCRQNGYPLRERNPVCYRVFNQMVVCAMGVKLITTHAIFL